MGLSLLILVAFIGTAGLRLVLPFVTYFLREDLSTTMVGIALITAGFMLARAISSMISGTIIEKTGKVLLTVVVGMILNIVIIGMYSLVSNWIEAIILRILQGFLSGMTWPLIQLIVALASPKHLRGRILTLYFAVGSLGIFFGNAIYALIYKASMEYGLFISMCMFLLSTVLVIISIRILDFKYTPKPELSVVPSERIISGEKRLTLPVFIGGFAIAYGSVVTIGSIAYVYLYEVFSIPKPITALILGASGVVGILSSLVLGWIADKRSEILAISIPLVAIILAPVLLLIKNMELLLISIILIAIAIKAYTPLSRRIVAVHTNRAAIGIGKINAIMNIGVSIGHLIFGILYDTIRPLTYPISTIEIVLPSIILSIASPLALTSLMMLIRSSKR